MDYFHAVGITVPLFAIVGIIALLVSPQNDETSSLLQEGIILTIVHRFEEAQERFKRVQELEEENPAGYFYEAALLQSKMMDWETDQFEKDFLDLIDRAIGLARKRIRRGQEDPWAHFYLGSALSYKGFYLARKGRWLTSLYNAVQGVKELERAVKIDSTLYDAYLGIGTYKYWRSRLTQIFHWLPFFPDEREEGIRMVRLALQRGRYSRYVALSNLTWILMDAGRVRESIRLSQQGLELFPGSRFFLWSLAGGYFMNKNYRKAIEAYQRILDSLKGESYNNHYNELICRLKIAQSYFQLGDYKRSLEECERILNLDLKGEIKKKAGKKIKEAKKLRALCLKRLNP